MSEPSKRIARTERDSNWYFVFISIIFGVFIAVWIEPVTNFFPYDGTLAGSAEVRDTSGVPASSHATAAGANSPMKFARAFDELGDRIVAKEMLIGAIMFLILVCLWWWYGTFLGNLSPAKGFWLYLYDFITLCNFAIGFRLWYHPIVFPIISVVAATLMLVRFVGVLILVDEVKAASRARSALLVAIGVLVIFVGIGIGMVAMPYLQASSADEYLRVVIKSWGIYQMIVIVLLVAGIVSTILAVSITEGRPFRFPREAEDWKTARPPKSSESKGPIIPEPDREMG